MPKYRPLVPIPEFGKDAVCADDARGPFLAWKAAVESRGGKLVANSLTRTVAQQQPLRDRYVAWLNAGKPSPAVAAANKPGRSNHQGGRAIDVSTVNAFPGQPANKQVDLLWETGKPLGFTPIIAAPDETKSERWHFDFWGDWVGVLNHLGYETACLCSALDVGQAGEWQSDARLIQALLLRAGYDIGEPDGIAGKRTQKALALAGIVPLGKTLSSTFGSRDADWDALRALPVRHTWQKVTA